MGKSIREDLGEDMGIVMNIKEWKDGKWWSKSTEH